MKVFLVTLTVYISTSFLSLLSYATAPDLKADFSSAELPESWHRIHGEWTVVDDALLGSELTAEKHAAVFFIPDSHANSTLRFRVRLDGAKGFHLSYNHPEGHLFRITLVEGVVTMMIDRDSSDPTSKRVELAKATVKTKPGEWIDVQCKIKANQATFSCGGATLQGSHANLSKEKTGYRFVVLGASAAFDDIAFSSSK